MNANNVFIGTVAELADKLFAEYDGTWSRERIYFSPSEDSVASNMTGEGASLVFNETQYFDSSYLNFNGEFNVGCVYQLVFHAAYKDSSDATKIFAPDMPGKWADFETYWSETLPTSSGKLTVKATLEEAGDTLEVDEAITESIAVALVGRIVTVNGNTYTIASAEPGEAGAGTVTMTEDVCVADGTEDEELVALTLTDDLQLFAAVMLLEGESLAGMASYKQDKTLYFSDVAVDDWDADETYADYPYRASVALTDVDATMLPEVIYDVAEATSGNYAPVCAAYSGGVYIYSNKDDEITIPSIKCEVTQS